MTRQKMLSALQKWRACNPAQKWAGSTKGTPKQLWVTCPRGDWLLWLAVRAGADRKVVALAMCACARLALPYVTPGEKRPLKAIDTAERWARGEAGVTLADVRAAADAAYAASAAAYVAASADAAYAYADAYADAAYAASAAAYVAAYADAAYAYADAAYAASAAYAAAYAAASKRTEVLAQCANIVRERITWQMVEAKLS